MIHEPKVKYEFGIFKIPKKPQLVAVGRRDALRKKTKLANIQDPENLYVVRKIKNETESSD